MSTTPLRRQYLRIKQRFQDAIVLFRLGDFYETFDEDARVTARELGITLTSRELGQGVRIPMAGIPYHALDNYLGKLLAQGYRVAICEQLTVPTGRGLVEREVVRVVTPGTVVEPYLLDQKSNNYLVSLVGEDSQVGIAHVDITTGEFGVTQLSLDQLPLELERLRPAEVLLPQDGPLKEVLPATVDATRAVTGLPEEWFDLELAQESLLQQLGVITLESFGCANLPLAIRAAGAIVSYLEQTQKSALAQLTGLSTYSTQSFMVLDPQTQRSLELFQGGRSGSAAWSLLAVLDFTKTPMGGRLLKRWLGQPLLDLDQLNQRQEAVSWLFQKGLSRATIASRLGQIADLERLITRVRSNIATPRDLVALKRGLEVVPALRSEMEGEEKEQVAWLLEGLKPSPEIVGLLTHSIVDDPPATVGEGGVIKEGFSPELDEIRRTSKEARSFIGNLERREQERTGIKSLKVGYNRVFGYYIEVSKPNLPQAPQEYIRKQTIANGERFITPELKEYESLILNAQERIVELESNLFRQVCSQVASSGDKTLAIARCLAQIDVLASFGEAAARYAFVRPQLTEDGRLLITNGRHPVVERALPAGVFVPNDTALSPQDQQIIVLTGPNMSGKSTYLRQVALTVLMAQIGSFVPADSATIGLADRIFTRIGLQDDLAAGQSTFMVEMIETAQILHHATHRSLIILDEIGRGTSTYDGLAIAWSVIEYLHHHPKLEAKTLFATHYHELTDLASRLPRVKNYHVAVSEEGGQVVFLHKIIPGAADKSYGVHVAQLAGLPRAVIRRSQELLSDLEAHQRSPSITRQPGSKRNTEVPTQQPLLFGQQPAWVESFLKLELDALTPLEALTKLYEFQRQAREDQP